MAAAVLLLGIGAGLAPATANAKDASPQTAADVEDHFRAPGPSAVTTGSASDESGETYTLFYPTDLATDGFDNPIVTWGNGTGGTPDLYEDTLSHLASWGFVVVASDSGQTGDGSEMLAGANFMVSEDGNPSSTFYQQLDTSNIAAAGHSQGAGGALMATLDSDGLITSTVTVALPDPLWWSFPAPDLAPLTDPIFFVWGSADFLSTASAHQNWYDQVAGAAAKAALDGGGHNTIQDPDNPLQGYVTAWLKYTLQGDNFARGAFVGNPPEINADSAWANQAEKNLP